MDLKENKDYLEAGVRLLEYLRDTHGINREKMAELSGGYWRPLRAELGQRDIFALVNPEYEVFNRPDLVIPMLAGYRYQLNEIKGREKELQEQRKDRHSSKVAQWVLIVITSLTFLLSVYQLIAAEQLHIERP